MRYHLLRAFLIRRRAGQDPRGKWLTLLSWVPAIPRGPLWGKQPQRYPPQPDFEPTDPPPRATDERTNGEWVLTTMLPQATFQSPEVMFHGGGVCYALPFLWAWPRTPEMVQSELNAQSPNGAHLTRFAYTILYIYITDWHQGPGSLSLAFITHVSLLRIRDFNFKRQIYTFPHPLEVLFLK